MKKVLLEKKELDTIKEIQQTELNSEIVKLQSKSQKFGDDLQQKYGDGNINIETGEFTKID